MAALRNTSQTAPRQTAPPPRRELREREPPTSSRPAAIPVETPFRRGPSRTRLKTIARLDLDLTDPRFGPGSASPPALRSLDETGTREFNRGFCNGRFRPDLRASRVSVCRWHLPPRKATSSRGQLLPRSGPPRPCDLSDETPNAAETF